MLKKWDRTFPLNFHNNNMLECSSTVRLSDGYNFSLVLVIKEHPTKVRSSSGLPSVISLL